MATKMTKLSLSNLIQEFDLFSLSDIYSPLKPELPFETISSAKPLKSLDKIVILGAKYLIKI